jgi:hypothetical protein
MKDAFESGGHRKRLLGKDLANERRPREEEERSYLDRTYKSSWCLGLNIPQK